MTLLRKRIGKMKWLAVADYHEMSRIGAERIYNVIAEASKARRRVNIGLATGNTMLELYPALAKMLNENKVRLDLLNTYNLDEYVADGKAVPHSHPLSYYTYMHENLFRHIDPALGLTEDRIHFPDPLNPDAFGAELAAGGGLDLQLLGIGFNGHIAFNEPQSESEISVGEFAALPTRVISLKPLTIETNSRLTAGGREDVVPRQAVSMGMKPILAAKKMLLLACFPEQEKPLSVMKHGRPTPELPASYMLEHKDSEIIYTADQITLK